MLAPLFVLVPVGEVVGVLRVGLSESLSGGFYSVATKGGGLRARGGSMVNVGFAFAFVALRLAGGCLGWVGLA